MPVSSWSTTASSNATADSASGINWSEGQAPSSINDSARALMAVIKGDLANSLAASGYQKFPNGLIVQWLSVSGGAAGSINAVWPTTFPTACLHVFTTIQDPGSTVICTAYALAKSVSNATIQRLFDPGGSGAIATASTPVSILAIGY